MCPPYFVSGLVSLVDLQLVRCDSAGITASALAIGGPPRPSLRPAVGSTRFLCGGSASRSRLYRPNPDSVSMRVVCACLYQTASRPRYLRPSIGRGRLSSERLGQPNLQAWPQLSRLN
ncbi:unnamed protein product [Protopolystoma xenopodis]|uniref:Uncharacterized protein n=1 Tax=Protopolystoma xenopodis TaxID=117903 RepID=A0A448XFK1_9PLAT|nr:unnamed protein product [Protopolystoma xenopodis]